VEVSTTVQIQSQSSGRLYSVTHHDDNSWSCECPGWRFKKAAPTARTCKHVIQAMGHVQVPQSVVETVIHGETVQGAGLTDLIQAVTQPEAPATSDIDGLVAYIRSARKVDF
jgi:hypothetical protein